MHLHCNVLLTIEIRPFSKGHHQKSCFTSEFYGKAFFKYQFFKKKYVGQRIFKLFAYFVHYELELLEIFNKFAKNEADTDKTGDERQLIININDHTKNSI